MSRKHKHKHKNRNNNKKAKKHCHKTKPKTKTVKKPPRIKPLEVKDIPLPFNLDHNGLEISDRDVIALPYYPMDTIEDEYGNKDIEAVISCDSDDVYLPSWDYVDWHNDIEDEARENEAYE